MDNNSVSNPVDSNLNLSPNDSQSQVNSANFLLPRSAWSSQVAYLRVIFRTKKALDRIEQEAKYEYSNLK
uniref:Uncharacterized protein n=1 Tax=Nostoc sp. PCC 9201 TaxID=2099382 RepID=A0A2P0ZGP0_9NOSO|nr:hypothetical protein [Nostoc sp. PCC 9201]